MSKLNAIVIASTLLFVAATQAAPATAAEAHQAQTAQAMRTEGVDHLIPAGRDAVAAPIRSAVAKPAARTERADTKPAQAATQAVDAAQPAVSRAQVIAELKRAREDADLEFHVAELGYVSAPLRRSKAVVQDTRLASLPAATLR